jgi:eukaryotic-like serine/threonine-protein kinase
MTSDLLSRLQQALGETYAIERELGRGGMATVFLARDLKHGRDVAMKVLHPDLARAVGYDRFRREIQIETRLTHPNILPLYDSGEADGLLFYVMPFIAGESLRARMTREHQLPIDEAVRITCEVADALDYAHRHGLIHRDIKPENILLEDNHAIVADFGIARLVTSSADEKLTETGVTLGTPLYMSPEQGMAQRDLDGRSDQYSLACVLYEMLAGQPPFTGPTAQSLIARHALDSVPPLLTVRETVPEEIENAIMCALAKVPADRFATMAAFAAALRGTGTFPMRRPTMGRTGTQRVTRSWRPRALAAVVVLVALVVSGAVWQIWGRQTRVASAGTLSLDPRRVAVLYFEDESRDQSLGYLADGLTESLIAQLGQVEALDVISTNGVRAFRNATDLDSVSRALKVGTVVRGTVEPVDDRVRVSVRLVDGNSGAEFQRGAFMQSATDPLAARDTLADRVTRFLRERLGEEIRLRAARVETRSPEAWSLLQQAERIAKEAEALADADSAVAAASRFAAADSLLTYAKDLDPRWPAPIVARGALAQRALRFTEDKVRAARLIDSGIAHADSALRLDARNADALELRGALRYARLVRGLAPDPTDAANLLRDAEADLREAVTISPTQAGAWSTLSHLHYRKYNKVEANLAARRAYEADAYLAAAREVLWRLYATSYDLEQFTDAIHWCDELRRRYPRDVLSVRCGLWLFTTSAREPDVDEAWRLASVMDSVAAGREMLRREARILVAAAIGRRGMLDSARHVLERTRADRSIDPRGELMGFEAAVRTILGDKDEAIRLLQVYLTSNPAHREGFVKNSAWWWRPLWDDPRYKELIGSGS